jgi:hypothetical protein
MEDESVKWLKYYSVYFIFEGFMVCINSRLHNVNQT